MPVTDAARRPTSHSVLVIGGGNAGLSVAGRLRRLGVKDIAVIEPRTEHLYKPIFSHIAGGTAPASKAVRSQRSVTPKGVEWIQDAVTSIDPDADTVTLASGSVVGYDHLIICPGIQKDWDGIPGLAEAMRTPEGISNYEFDLAQKASARLRDITRGTVVFSQPAGPASCAGAGQKPMYLACDYWRARGILSDIEVVMLVPDETVFGMPDIDRELNRKIAEYGITLRTQTTLGSVDAASRTIVTEHPVRGSETLSYDLLSVEPPQSAPDWLVGSGLTDASGFVDVDPYTLRHPRHGNVWALGDAAATLNSKSGGALRKQTLTLAKNLVAVLRGEPMPERYNGYSVCPFTVSRSTVVFAEFDDQYRPVPSVPFWKGLARERRLTWVFDRHILPWVYWHMILQGRA
ncbi:NAD(P)/FAD-dependent oxidoreductase [Microbacterium pygmaeum]|uniref:Sulfide:quinone oxidoreductase n=1 Tax=Microbacterium pygmaeum TaxID=370764 RepID=A0A1G7X2Y4_9MICO|nr:FAD-dependent oxidoreductase [Microbacterium pygmaeum]SDG77920.1 sulfide:quinone oxidoreductase [Microbacterium pygmaeum]